MHYQADPPPPAVPPAPTYPQPRRLTRRQLTISIGAVAAFPVLLVAFAMLSPSKLERAGDAIGRECFVQENTGDRLRFTANYKSTECLLATRAQLEELGFDRGDLEDAADRQVTAGRYVMTAGTVAGDGPSVVQVTIRTT